MNNKSLRITPEFHEFLLKLGVNRIKAETDNKQPSLIKCCEIMRTFFKENNEEYIKLVQHTKGEKC